MDKLSEYIPLLIILVSLIFSIIGKKKKQDKVTQQTTLPGIPAGEFVDEINLPPSYLKTAEKKQKKQTFHTPEITKKKENEQTFFPDYENLESKEENEHSAFSFENEEDVRRAVIYAEIINRKEY